MKVAIPIVLALFILSGVSVTARAQIVVPETHHYADAYDMIAREKALREVRELDRAAEELAELAALAREVRIASQARHEAIVGAWAKWIQRQHGMRPRSPKAGIGWHEVHRGD